MMENRNASLPDWMISRHQEDNMPPLRYWQDESADSPVIWEHDYSVVHAGWTMLYLYRENGADYLMEYSPYMNHIAYSYSYSLHRSVKKQWKRTPTQQISHSSRRTGQAFRE